MEDNQLYACFWVCVVVALSVLMICITINSLHEIDKVASMPNPALYRCADSPDSMKNQFCINLSQQK